MATRPVPTNRTSTSTSKVSGPPLQSHPTALVSPSASFTGVHPISIGSDAIIQLRSHLSSAMGPVDIGDGCIINERASIGCSKPLVGEIGSDSNTVASTSLAAGVLIESGATIEAGSIGDFTIVEAGAKTGRGAVVGKNCKICAQVQIGEGEVIEDSTVVFGSGWGERRVEGRGDLMDEKRERWMREQRKVLRRAWTGK